MKNKYRPKQVTVSAPGKLMLSVGYAVVHGYPAIVTAVDQRIFVTVSRKEVSLLKVEAPDLGVAGYEKPIENLGKNEVPKAVSFIEILYKNFLKKYPQNEGIMVTTKSDFSATYGFGSSSAVTVAFAKALTTLYEIQLTKLELFKLCYETVLEVQGVGSGFDLASAIWGKTIYYVSPAKVVKYIDIKDLPLMIVYSGEKADTPTLIRMVDEQLKENPEKIDTIFKRIAAIIDSFADPAKKGDWKKIGDLFNESQECARELGVSTNRLENLISTALDSGAYGATASGSAGGDCVLIVVSKDKQKNLKEALEKIGGKIIDASIDAEAAKIEDAK